MRTIKLRQSSATFPKLTPQKKTGRTGVGIVSEIVSNQLEWLFRKVDQDEDFGIDGYLDVVDEEGNVTGQSIAVQIKAGQSFFSTTTQAGVVFRGETKHLNYYLNNPLPILIILCDLSLKKSYYEVFHPDKTEKTEGGWKIVVPFAQVFDSSSKEELLRLVGKAIDHTSALEEQWATTKLLGEMERIMFAVSRDHIEALNTDSIGSFFDRIVANATLCAKLQGKVDVSISGYESDSRELWQIAKVREWFSLAFPRVKYWFFFLPTDVRAGGLKTLFVCLCNAKKGPRKDAAGRIEVILNKTMIDAVFNYAFPALNELTDRLSMPLIENKRISYEVTKALYPDFEADWYPSKS